MIATRVITHRHCHRLSEVFFRARVRTKNPIYQRQILFLDLVPFSLPPTHTTAPSPTVAAPRTRHKIPPSVGGRPSLRGKNSTGDGSYLYIRTVCTCTCRPRIRLCTYTYMFIYIYIRSWAAGIGRKRDKLGVLFQSDDRTNARRLFYFVARIKLYTHTHTPGPPVLHGYRPIPRAILRLSVGGVERERQKKTAPPNKYPKYFVIASAYVYVFSPAR